MAINFMTLREEPAAEDWRELDRAGDWQQLLVEEDFAASSHFTGDVLRLLTFPGAVAQMREIAELVGMAHSIRHAAILACCVLRLEEIGMLQRVEPTGWQARQ